MCADFTLSQIGDVGASPAPQQGVQQPSAGASLANFGEGLLKSFAAGAPQRAAQAEAEQEIFKQKAADRFMRQQMTIAEAVDTGELTSQEARMRMRANLSAALADNEGMGDVFSAAHAQVLETAGMGKVASTGTEAEQQWYKVRQEAFQNGFVAADATEAEAASGVNNWIQLNQARLETTVAKEELSLRQAQQTFTRGQIGLETDRINLKVKKAEYQATQGVKTQLASNFPRFARQLQDIQARVGIPPEQGGLTPDEAVLEARTLMDQLQGEARSQGSHMSETQLNNLLMPYQRMADTFRETVTGKLSTEVLGEIQANSEAQADLALSLDPRVQSFAAVSRVFGQNASAILNVAGNTYASDIIAAAQEMSESGGQTPFTFRGPNGAEAMNGYVRSYLLNGTRMVNRGQETMSGEEEVVGEVAANVNTLLTSMEQQSEALEFKDWRPLMDYLGGQDYAEFVTGKGKSAISRSSEAQARDFTQRFFADQIQPLIAEKWRNAVDRPVGVRPGPDEETEVPSVIRPFFAGDGIRFQITDESARGEPRIQRKLRELNETVAPAVNTFIRVGAHLEKHTDYERIYESNYAGIFGDAGTGATDGGRE